MKGPCLTIGLALATTTYIFPLDRMMSSMVETISLEFSRLVNIWCMGPCNHKLFD